VKKIIKFEKIMNKFCKDIGLDKKSLLYLLLGGAEGGQNPHELSDRKDNKMYQSLGGSIQDQPNGRESGGGTINTGIAAQLAYNNIIGSSDIE
jgi:hypothetical protein